MTVTTEIAALAPTTWQILVTLVAILVFSFIINRVFFYKPFNLPPGPLALPIVGNFLPMVLSGEGLKLVGKWAQDYGPIITVWLCHKCVIIISDPDIAQEALIGSGNKFASRSGASAGAKHFQKIKFRMLTLSPYDDYWRSARKNLANHVLTKGARTALQPIREEEFRQMMEILKAKAQDDPDGVALRQHLRLASCAIFFRVCFGKRADKSILEELNNTLDQLLREFTFQLNDFLAFLAPFLKHKQHKRIDEMVSKLAKIFAPMIAEQRELRKSGQKAPTYLDNVLDLQEEIGLCETNVVALLTELLFGGIDTSTSTTEWTLGELMANPQTQKKLFDEIFSVVGKRPITEDDIPNLPYLRAVVQENLRKNPTLPSLVSHAPAGPGGKIAGYDIPESALLLISAKRIQNDPRVWNDPDTFKPERFLDSDGKFIDQMSISPGGKLKIIPFGAGRRVCPGMATGLTIVHFLVARLVQAFEFSPVDHQKGVDFTPAEGSLLNFKTPSEQF